jgi:fumarylacetoacetase
MRNSVHPTCDPTIRSWILSANEAGSDFPIQNLPFGVFRDRDGEGICIGVAIGDAILDLHGIADAGLLAGLPAETVKASRQANLNQLMSLGPAWTSALRTRLSALLRDDAERAIQERMAGCLFPQREVTMLLPAVIGDYTDFYASIDHATRAGRLFRPDHPLLPNYKHIPIGYHGRASSLVISGTQVQRPMGQIFANDRPEFTATRLLDYEAEVGFFAGQGNVHGKPVHLARASEYIFGACLVNDWSARDIQSWEYQPLGPFLAKSFATSISPWVVTMEALTPFRVAPRPRDAGDPEIPDYLRGLEDQQEGALHIELQVWIRTASMRTAGEDAALLSSSNTRDLYWTPAQMLTHHTSNGCNLRSGDLFATGTVSGREAFAMGCLLELTQRGLLPVVLPNGERRGFLEDGDEVILRGYCVAEGAARIGFGECRGIVAPTHP